MLDAISQFRAAIQAAGITPPDVIEADGKLRRFASRGKKNDDAGWYVLYADGICSGSFGDWSTGISQTWHANIGRPLTSAESESQRTKAEAMRRAREADAAKRKAEARDKAAAIWQTAHPAPENSPYLSHKHVKAHGVRLYKEALLVPMWSQGTLHSLQFISPDGRKRFLTGGQVTGCYFSIGKPTVASALCIAEGFATGASIHEATGLPVAIAFNAGNLVAVAKAMQEKFPRLPLIICADDDSTTTGNPGLAKATEAARAVGGILAIPNFGTHRPDNATDFNDMAASLGIEAVRQLVLSTIPLQEEAASEVSEVQASNGEALVDTPDQHAEGAEVSIDAAANPIPEIGERPCFRVFDDWQNHAGAKFRPGVWYFGTDKDGNPTHTWVCSPLHVEAITYDGQDSHFGRLLRFKNTLRRWREWAMPMDMLRGAGDDLRGELLAMGVEIDPTQKARNLLGSYLQAIQPKRQMRCTQQVGWCDGSFVLPDTVIGPVASTVIFQSGEHSSEEHTRGGTLQSWQAEISARAVGNPLLVLALSASFTGPLLARCNAEGGGVHFVGDSSTGKTTLLEAGCSVWGGANYRRSWRSTANGMEGAAALFNDCLLALDEISECDPREVGAIVYALGNGRGKQRAGRTGSARAVTRWRCFVLSSGERTISTTMQEGGHRAKAGQSVRLLDIPAARNFGAWDQLHDMPSGTAFSDAIKRASVTHYGHAGRAFLEKLTRDPQDFCALLERIKALPQFSAAGAEGQEKRAATRFAILAMAGEIATEYGLTGWPEGEAIKAAIEGFRVWRTTRGNGNDEQHQVLDRVSAFIERHGDSRFSEVNSGNCGPVRERAGWWKDSPGGRTYLFNADGMHEALKGFDFTRALDVLQKAEALPPSGADGKRAKFYRIGTLGVKLYPINATKLGDNHGA